MRIPHLICTLLVAIFVFIFPVEASAARKIKGGMTEAQVTQIWGEPDGYSKIGNPEVLTYTNRLISGWSWDRADFHVVLTDGRVAQFGFGKVRQGGPSVFVIVPIK